MHTTKSMKLFFTLCLLALSSMHICLAKNNILDELLNESNSQRLSKNYPGALRANNLALAVAEENKASYFSYFGSIHAGRFLILHQMQQYDEAYTAALRTKEIYSTDPEKDGAYYSFLLNELAEMLMEQGKYKAAEKFALESIENMELKGSTQAQQLPRLYQTLSDIYINLGQLDQAVLILKKSIIFSKKWGIDAATQTSEALIALSKVYLALGQTDLAEQALQEKKELKFGTGYISVIRAQPAKKYSPATLDGKTCSPPQYTAEALQKSLHGTAKFRFLISETGEIAAKYISTSSGSLLLDTATLQAFSTCKFSPARENDIATRSWYSGQFAWVLPD
ncbi:TonB family protein [Undibacterium sp. Ji42W]|uniref:TonB family protein n=1 Tax=Undibacterium sp. Ji42W TaxID=3413039 RepID=UPI003BEFE76D